MINLEYRIREGAKNAPLPRTMLFTISKAIEWKKDNVDKDSCETREVTYLYWIKRGNKGAIIGFKVSLIDLWLIEDEIASKIS